MSAIYDYAGALWKEMKQEFDAALAWHMVAAETATNGNLSTPGHRADSVFTGTGYRHASEELLEFWQHTPRPTLVEFEKQWMAARTGWQ